MSTGTTMSCPSRQRAAAKAEKVTHPARTHQCSCLCHSERSGESWLDSSGSVVALGLEEPAGNTSWLPFRTSHPLRQQAMRPLLRSWARISLFSLASFVFLLTACQRSPVTSRTPDSSGVAAFTANRFTIHRRESAVLRWSCINAKSVSISEIGAVAVTGAFPVRPVATTTYVLTAQFASGTVTRAVTISVL
jgi:hypothetical protein